MKALAALARMLGVPAHQAEDALHSESAARAVPSRRNLFAAGAALAAGSVLVGGPLPLHVFTDDCEWWVAPNLAEAYAIRELHQGTAIEDGELEQEPDHKRMRIMTDDTPDGSWTPLGFYTLAEWARQEGPGFLCTTEY